MARKWWDTTKAVKDKMSAVKKSSPQHSSLHPETALLTFCGTLGYFHPVYSLMLPNCVAAQMPEHGGWPMAQGGAAILIRGSRGVGRPGGHGLVRNVKSITEQIQHTLNIAKVTAQAKGQPALRRVAPRRSPASLDAVRSQPEVDTG
jgi:hypothetical protein